jgi:hypothetical protein
MRLNGRNAGALCVGPAPAIRLVSPVSTPFRDARAEAVAAIHVAISEMPIRESGAFMATVSLRM